MNPSIPIKNQWVASFSPSISEFGQIRIERDLPELDREELIAVIKKLAALRENGTLNDEDLSGVLRLALGQYVENEVERKLTNTFERKFSKIDFFSNLI